MQTIQTVQKMPHIEVSSGPVGLKQWYIKPLKHQTKIAADEFNFLLLSFEENKA